MYHASSVIRSLRQETIIEIVDLDLVICPDKYCTSDPDNCEKGQSESCEKKINIIYTFNGHKNLAVLLFYYQLGGNGREGFIRTGDNMLGKLIGRGIINEETLLPPIQQDNP